MPKIVCTCGNPLPFGEIPCSIEYKFISDCEYDQYQGIVDAEILYQSMKSMLRCADCERIWIFWDGYKNNPTEYVKK